MGLIDKLIGLRVCIDTAPFIYFIEKHQKYFNVIRPVFVEIDTGKIEAIGSTVILLEVLVHPFKMKNEFLAERYRVILLNSEGLITFEILNEVSELASKLRTIYSIRTPDALLIATGVLYGATVFKPMIQIGRRCLTIMDWNFRTTN